MDFYELIEYRKSVRAYKRDPIEPEKLDRVLNAGRLAPAGTDQAYRFIVVTDPATKRKLGHLSCKQHFVGEAPVVLVACALPAEGLVGGVLPCSVTDTAIAVTHMMLAAAAERLGTCWIGAFETEPIKKLLGVPDDATIVALLPTGYPVDDRRVAKSRKPLAELTCRERYTEDSTR
jgi:nitroreductase